MTSVVMTSVVMTSVVMSSVFMTRDVMTNTVAPKFRGSGPRISTKEIPLLID